MSGFGTYTWSSGNIVYEGNLRHFDLAFLKVSIFFTKSVYKLKCNLECNPLINNKTGIRGGSCNPSYWEVGIGGWFGVV
jgi:hypothetical protein